jgi:hypothetical protein
MARDTTHLTALYARLAHEKERLAQAGTPKERELRSVWVGQIEKEIAGERQFLGMPADDFKPAGDANDDDLLAQLLA